MNLSETHVQDRKVLKEGFAIKSISKLKNSSPAWTVNNRILSKMYKMAISAGKTVTNCQFSPKMSIEFMFSKVTRSVFSDKSSTGKFTSCHSLMCAKPKLRVTLWSVTPYNYKTSHFRKKNMKIFSEWKMVIEPFEIGFYPLDTFNIPTDSENEWEEAKSNKGMTILYRSYGTQISY